MKQFKLLLLLLLISISSIAQDFIGQTKDSIRNYLKEEDVRYETINRSLGLCIATLEPGRSRAWVFRAESDTCTSFIIAERIESRTVRFNSLSRRHTYLGKLDDRDRWIDKRSDDVVILWSMFENNGILVTTASSIE